MRQGGDDLALDRDSMFVDLLAEGFAERNCVFSRVAARRGLIGIVAPKSKAVEEVKACPVRKAVSHRLIVGTEEDGRREDPLEALDDAAVVAAVFGKAEEVQHPGGTVEVDPPTLLVDRECRNPDGNEPVLAERQTELGMPCNLKKELPIAPRVGELTFGRGTKGKPTEHERTSVVGEGLLAAVAFVADEGDSFQLTEPELCETNGGQNGVQGNARKSRNRPGSSSRPSTAIRVAVRKLCQKSKKLMGKGFCFERKQMSPS